jgi:hypothetical protein
LGRYGVEDRFVSIGHGQETYKLAGFLKCLTLPILASAIEISCDSVTSHG